MHCYYFFSYNYTLFIYLFTNNTTTTGTTIAGIKIFESVPPLPLSDTSGSFIAVAQTGFFGSATFNMAKLSAGELVSLYPKDKMRYVEL